MPGSCKPARGEEEPAAEARGEEPDQPQPPRHLPSHQLSVRRFQGIYSSL